MSYTFCFDRSISPRSPVRATAERVYSAALDPVTLEDRYEAARHSSKRFWDLALLGGPHLVRHGGRDWVARNKLSSLQKLLPGLALSAAAVGVLPLTAIASYIRSRASPRTVASADAAFVHRLKTAIDAHRRDIDSLPMMTKGQMYGELNLHDEVNKVVLRHPVHRVKNSNSLDWKIGVWRELLFLMQG